MGTPTIELPSQVTQREFNERRWAELLEDRELARFEGRVETDRHGQIIMSPPSAACHGRLQSTINHLLHTHTPAGSVLTECPISTADGVRAADVAWASKETMRALGDRVCFPRAPEVCVEVLSPRNTKAEIREKTVGREDQAAALPASKIVPAFPAHITLR